MRNSSVVRLGSLIALIAAAVLLAFGASWGIGAWSSEGLTTAERPEDRGNAALWPASPQSMTELVDSADVIAVGRIQSVVGEHEVGPYEDSSIAPADETTIVDERATATPTLPGLHVTIYDVVVDRVVLGAGRVEAGDTIKYLEAGSAAKKLAFADNKPMPQPGDEFLFALVLNPDGANYSAGRWGLFDVSSDTVVYADWDRTTVPFAAEQSPAEFIANLEIEAAIKERGAP